MAFQAPRRGAMFYLGCAVWAFKDWVGDFYPAKASPSQFLQLYGERLTTVEGNTTFYNIPDRPLVERWANQTPETFRFCPKLPRLYSHQGALMPHRAGTEAFLDILQGLGPRLGPVFIQLPPSYGPDRGQDLQAFLTAWPRSQVPVAVEVRHRAWFQDPHRDRLRDLLTELGVGRVLLDSRPMYDGLEDGLEDPQITSERRKPRVPLQPEITAPFTLVRYISHPHRPSNEPYIEGWVPRLRDWITQGIDTYLFIHCPDEAQSPAIARHFYDHLQGALPSLPPLPWAEITPPPSQLSLF
jgi:uncharacterized protein YecE (DUF72 family)